MNKYEVIKKHIDAYDYYGLLAIGAPNDEFDTYSRKFVDLITEDKSVEDIARIISETMDKAFREEINPDKFMNTARLIYEELYGNKGSD